MGLKPDTDNIKMGFWAHLTVLVVELTQTVWPMRKTWPIVFYFVSFCNVSTSVK